MGCGETAPPPKNFACRQICSRSLACRQILQYIISVSRRWKARKGFFIGNFGLREVFFVLKLGFEPQKFPLSLPLAVSVCKCHPLF